MAKKQTTTERTIKTSGAFKASVKDMQAALTLCHLARLIPFFEGNRGTGKTSLVNQWADDNNRVVVTQIMSGIAPENVIGIPVPSLNEEGTLTGDILVTKPDIIASVERAKKESGKDVVLFFDELPNAALEVQSPLFRLFLEGMLGEYALPENTYIVAAGNSAEDSVAAGDLAQPLMDRLVFYNFAGPSKNEFMKYMGKCGFAVEVQAFLQKNPEWLHGMTHELEAKGERITPTPRAWERASQLLEAGKELGHTTDSTSIKQALIGTVGPQAFYELHTYFAEMGGLPDVENVLKAPKKASIPKSVIGKMLIALQLGRSVVDEKSFEAYATYAQRLPTEITGMFLANVVNRPEANWHLSTDNGIAIVEKYIDVIELT